MRTIMTRCLQMRTSTVPHECPVQATNRHITDQWGSQANAHRYDLFSNALVHECLAILSGQRLLKGVCKRIPQPLVSILHNLEGGVQQVNSSAHKGRVLLA